MSAKSKALNYSENENNNMSQVYSIVAGLFQINNVVPRAGLEPATTSLPVNLNDIDDFILFAQAKLNLTKLTAKQYSRRVRAFLVERSFVTDRDIQVFIQKKKESCTPNYVSNIISSFKAYFRDYKGLSWMNDYKHPSTPLKLKPEIKKEDVRKFIEAIDDLGVKCVALFLASSGLRRGEVLSLKESDVNRELRSLIPSCHSGQTKQSGITFYNEEAEIYLKEYEKNQTEKEKESNKLLPVRYERFFYAWRRARKKSRIYLKPKDLRDFFSQEMGKAFVPDRYIDIFQGRAPKNVLAKHYNPHGIMMLKEIYEKANLKLLNNDSL
jgi:integrase